MAKKTKGLPVEKRSATPIPVQIVDRPSTSSKVDMDRERKWKAEDALRDIERAEGHKRDATLMGDVKKLAKEKMTSLSKVCK